MYIILCITWVLTSTLVMMLYRFLAGNQMFPFEPTDIFIGAPIAIIVLFILMQNKIEKGLPKKYGGWYNNFTRGLRIFLGWSILPIFVNALSTFAKLLGFTNTADILFDLRYHSLWILAVFFSFIGILLFFPKRKPA